MKPQITKHNEAIGRNEAWRCLSPHEQLAELVKRPGRCQRQRAKILAKMKEDK